MDGVFMLKAKRLIACLCLIAVVVYAATLLKDKNALQDSVIRLHVVAASDSARDQQIKFQVRDAVIRDFHQELAQILEPERAAQYLKQQLPVLQEKVNALLGQWGSTEYAVVTFLQEEVPAVSYDGVQLPAGVYDSIRITIGSGEGEDWWCVAFPGLCDSLTIRQAENLAIKAGLSGSLAQTITGQAGYELRFFFLDLLGKVENFFHGE